VDLLNLELLVELLNLDLLVELLNLELLVDLLVDLLLLVELLLEHVYSVFLEFFYFCEKPLYFITTFYSWYSHILFLLIF
jgi:hypothetical protein